MAATTITEGRLIYSGERRFFSTTIANHFRPSLKADTPFYNNGGRRNPFMFKNGIRPGSSGFSPFMFNRSPVRFPFLRAILGIVLFTGFFVFVAAPLLFIVLPVLFILGAGFIKFNRGANRIQLAKAMKLLDGTGLKFSRSLRNPQTAILPVVEDPQLSRYINTRVKIFLEDQEQGNDLVERLHNGVNSVSILEDGFTSISQQWVANQNNMQELIIVLKTSVVDNTTTTASTDVVANLDIVMKLIDEGLSENQYEEVYDMVIVLKSGKLRYLINTGVENYYDDDNDGFIDIKNYKVRDL